MTAASDIYPGFISLDEAFSLTEDKVKEMQLAHMNEYRTKMGLEGGLTFDIKRAEGCHIWDAQGNKRLDFIGCVGVYLLGHNNPFIVENVIKYLGTKPLTMDPLALKPVTAAFAHNMALLTPELTRTIVNGGGGAEAVEAVLKLVRIAAGRNHPERKRIVSTLNSFHGKTLGAVTTGGKEVWRRWQPRIPDHAYVPYGDIAAVEEEFKKGDVIAFIAETIQGEGGVVVPPDDYFPPYGDIAAVEEEFKKGDVIAFIAETIQGEGGVVVPPDDYFPTIRRLCDEYGVYMILDEVQAGSCRTGYVWAHQYYEGLVPDAFTFAKGMSDGVLPVSGIQVNDSLYQEAYGSFDSAMMHTATYQDNNISAAVALSSLQYMIEHDVAGQVREKSKYIFAKLEEMREKYPDVRASGLGHPGQRQPVPGGVRLVRQRDDAHRHLSGQQHLRRRGAQLAAVHDRARRGRPGAREEQVHLRQARGDA